MQLIQILIRERWIVIACAGAGLAIGVYLVAIRPQVYSSTTVVVAAAPSGASNRLAGLASQLGLGDATGDVSLGVMLTPDLLETLATSDVILGHLVDDSVRIESGGSTVSLLSTLAPDTDIPSTIRRIRAIRELRRAVGIRKNKMTGTLTIEVTMRSPELSHLVARAVVAALNDYLLSLGRQQAAAERRFVTASMSQRKSELRAAEDRLATFLSANRQYQSSPQLVLEYERLQREVDLHQQVLVRLSQAAEEAGVREARDTPVVVVLEPAEKPILPKPRKPLRTLVVTLFVGLLVGTLAAFARFGIRQARASTHSDWVLAPAPVRPS